MLRACLRDPAFVVWRALAWLMEAPARSRLVRLASAGVRHNRWRMRLAAFGADSLIYPDVVIHAPEAVHIGHDVAIAEFTHIWGGGGVIIEDHVMIASHAVITSQTHETDVETRRTNVARPVRIEEGAWIGAGAILLPGVTVGRHAVVAAGSVVTADVPARAVVAGVPARVVRVLSSSETAIAVACDSAGACA